MAEMRVLATRVDVVGESLSVCEDERALLALQNGFDLLGLAFTHQNVKYGRALRTEVGRAEESGPIDHLFERGLAI